MISCASAAGRVLFLVLIGSGGAAASARELGAQTRIPRAEVRAIVDSAEAEMLRFFFWWGEAWRLSEAARHELELVLPYKRGTSFSFRQISAGCTSFLDPTRGRAGAIVGNRRIASRAGLHAACPSWYVGEDSLADDEAESIDNALIARVRADARDARARVIYSLDSASSTFPDDDWLIGQRVRLRIDQGDFRAALSVTTECLRSPWWCAMLRGYVLSRSGESDSAEAAFERGAALMPPRTRCAWTDLGALFDSVGRAAYAAASCEARDSLNRLIWWLADPLYIQPGNERKTEQFARRVRVTLTTALERDERYDWRASAGGDARSELVVRYGWPSYTFWPGYARDIGQSTYLADDRGGAHLTLSHGVVGPWYKVPAPLSEPATTYEFQHGRLHFVPNWTAVRRPFESESVDWELTDPAARPGDRSVFLGRGLRRIPGVRQYAADSAKIMMMQWWPVEHARSRIPVAELIPGQVALLRRDGGSLIGVAIDVSSAQSRRPPGATVSATLIATSSPDSLRFMASQRVRVDSVLVARGLIAARPSIIGVEFPNDATLPAGRTRFGVAPPPALIGLNPRDIAVSDPVLLRDTPTRSQQSHADSVLALMSASLSVDSGRVLKVYWESYGVAASDTADVAVWVQRYTPQGFARRLGIALGVTEDLNTPVVVRWRETAVPQDAHVSNSAVPIAGRFITVNTAALPRGDYWLGIAMARPGGEWVRGRRGFTIR